MGIWMNKIDKIIFKYFFGLELNHRHLCVLFHSTDFHQSWMDYWHRTRGDYGFVSSFFDENDLPEIYTDEYKFKTSLLRLLVVEDFKQYLKDQE